MINIPNYQINQQIYESTNSLVYRGIRTEDNQPIILKVLKEDYPSPEELTRYRQEYDITRRFNSDGIIKAYSLEKHQNTLVMCLEDFGGKSLKLWLTERQFTLAELLTLAIRATDILGQIHQQHIIHKDINPSNFIFNPTTGVLKIIDFGISTQLSRETPTLKNPNVLEGTLAYMSPEQTGRMNRALDYRTDFYSLGVTLYELFTQTLPFTTTDAMALVHCHIAKQPVPPSELQNLVDSTNPVTEQKIPQALSNIIMKLLEKQAEARYKSAWGLKADLQECKANLARGMLEPFTLAQKDISDRFQIPQTLYGRESEIDTLLAAFERVANPETQGKSEMMLVAGYSGIGKSMLVKEIYKSLTAKQGYFIAGKFDQFQRNIPYSAVVSAFGELVQQLLTSSEATLQSVKEKLLTALGANGPVITDVIPDIERIIGKQPPVQELGPTESQNRFNRVFQNFMRVFCQPEHPLVMFLDDLQWADLATLKLLELVMTDKETGYLFLIGAYRDNEVNPTHPLIMTLETLSKADVTLNQLILKPLTYEPLTQLIADSLSKKPTTVGSLTDLVIRKTGGNPFFVNQFLHTLYEENLLTFQTPDVSKTSEVSQFGWQWNIADIEAMNITDNVVVLMMGKLQKLPPATQAVLRLAACIGHQFDLNTLAVVHEHSKPDTFQQLMPALKEGLVLPASQLALSEADILHAPLAIFYFRFLHDRVQQAAYALIDDVQKQAVHLKIGRLLRQNTPDDKREEHLFDIVQHLNIGFEQVDNPTEKTEIAQLNLKAGQKAKAATAYAGAIQYLTAGINSLTADCWTQHYALTLALHKERCEVEYLSGHFDDSEKWCHLTLAQAKTDVYKAEIYRILILQYTMQARYDEALQAGKTGLHLLGIDLPESDFKTALEMELKQAKQNLGDREIHTLIDAPEMTMPEKKMAVKLLSHVGPPVFFSNQDLWYVLAVKSVNLSLQYGHVVESSFSYSAYGILLAVLEDYASAHPFGRLAVKLSEKFNHLGFKCQVTNIFASYINNWHQHLKQADVLNHEAFQAGLESGEIPYAGYSLMLIGSSCFFQGNNLTNVAENLQKFLMFAQNTNNQLATDMILGFHLVVSDLMGFTSDKGSFNSPNISGAAFSEKCYENKSFLSLCYHLTAKSQALYLYGQLAEALKYVLEAEKLLPFISSGMAVPEQNFYHSLILAALYPKSAATTQPTYWQQLAANQQRLKKWADNCPDNYLHKYLLVDAEMARLSGKDLEAMAGYDNSIASAKAYGFIQNEALANELAAQFWLAKGQEKFARLYLTESLYAYQLWGAVAKVKDLEANYSQLLSQKTGQPRQLQTRIATTATVMSTPTTTKRESLATLLDLNSVVKASQTLSGEIVLSQLLEKMMHIVIENAGAEKGFLLLPQQDNWFIEAASYVDKPEITVLQSQAIENSEQVAANIIRYVARTQEPIVLHDATQAGRFTHDPYIVSQRPKSVLCLPLVNQGQLRGLLYLENNLTEGAFTDERLQVLTLLSSQMAISIENSLLYNNLEQKVAERTSELAERTTELEQEVVVRKRAEDKAAVANQAKSAFLANMSHELRTPLNAILGFAQIMQRSRTLSSEHQNNVKIINRSGEYLLSLINDVLDMSKIEAGKITLDEQDFDLHSLLDEIHDLFYLKAENQHLQFVLERSDNVPRYIRTDGTKLRQVLINLLGNAIKFTQYGGVYLFVDEIMTHPRRELGKSPLEREFRGASSKEEPAETTLNFMVKDTGAGIADHELDKLFEAFGQTATGRDAKEGTGLGLPISRKFVQLMGSDITVQSEVGIGTIFQFIIRVPIVSSAEITSERHKNQVIALQPNQPRYRILIVDDKWDNRQLLIKLLNPLGFELREASNGQEAVDTCQHWQPHLIWMDIRMPVMDGLQATQQIKATESGQNIAIIALTATTLEEQQQAVLSAGCDDLLRKPFRDTDIFDLMHKHIGVCYILEKATDTTTPEETTENLTAAALKALPSDLLTQMQQAAVELDIDLMPNLIAQIHQQNEPLANALLKLANDFQYDILLNLIEQALQD